ncbi:MAG: nuclear transport factor 2 family protein [Syntrophorhabdales bacterium]|jgi:predicted SnoaL-like aldol condensation-catalyzing enzyme
MRISCVVFICVVLAFAIASPAFSAGSPQEEMNKKNAVEFYEKAINQKDFDGASKYIGSRYTQHNPLAADGPEGLKAFLQFAKEKLPGYHADIRRVLADGDYVILHVHTTRDPQDRGSAVMDIFKLENGKVVEHWDVVQPIPEKAANSNGMF